MTTQQRIPVWVKALDPLSQFGLVHALRQRPEIALISDAELTALTAQSDQRTAPPVVALIAVDALDAGAVQVLRAATQRGCRRTVLIGSTIDDDALMTAVELGVSGVLRRTEATAERIVHLLQTAAAGDGSLPADLLGRLLGQVSRMQRHVLAPRGLSHTGLSDRETQVLRLVADGKDTQEIARELSYSERTVKNVLHDVTSRLQLKNRSHAVAYALREGLI
ncbi:response regulator transcription factor [Kribbella sandramycini]|uniref:DNA-binding NarL/FixJ family response regulator n=1 Tax=Kribbella sandramycini TaxID=60450 RepID=A0A7Y4L6L7_9ACTN|nr:response regulator transcription factor [Kribbella sandramycini]MBB6570128.1 DNA-binding NarL/FixJ family response regulator [Kribbella sandramycini]NOL45370.1 response regulator transcription factor [Kribbella sandramycini]